MKKTLFQGALALPDGKVTECIKAICNSVKLVQTDILAKWTSLHIPSLGNDIPAMLIKKSLFECKRLRICYRLG